MRSIIEPQGVQPDPQLVLWAGGSKLLATLLQGRGIVGREQVEHLLNPLGRPEPDLSAYPPLVSAAKRIEQALSHREKIAVYGDYDVDGITATAVLVSSLEQLGGEVVWHVPNRFSEGYGMHPDQVKKLARAGVGLIVTCDCGISNHREVELANSLGMDVIITDHHTLPEQLPPAHSIVNFRQLPPGHPSRDLPGVGTAFVLARMLLERKEMDGSELLDLVALGIVADVVPLIGHNRQLYAKGLPVINRAQRPGLSRLLAVSSLAPGQVDEEKVAFQLAPRLNAAGRLEDGALAVRLLLARDGETAVGLARQLDQLNNRRKELGREIIAQLDPEPGRALVAYNPHWHQGVIGIAAGQVCSSINVPAVLITDSRNGEGLVGSARSVAGINIYEILAACSKYLEKFGGHPAAAGFSLTREKLDSFCAELEIRLERAMARWKPQPLQPELELQPGDITLELVAELNRLAPYGPGNPRPLLYCSQLTVKSLRSAGNGHILLLGNRRHSFSAGVWQHKTPPAEGRAIGAVFTLAEDQYRGERSVWATLEAWWPGKEAPLLRQRGPELVDMRGKPWQLAVEAHPEAALFREGADWLERPGATRIGLEAAPVLVALTPPPGPGIFRQILAAVEPATLVLAYSRPGRSKFLQDLVGSVKYILNNESGIVRLSVLAAAMGHNENTVLAGLRLLAASQVLDFQLEEGKLVLQQLGGAKLQQGREAEQLRQALEETDKYRQWLMEAGVDELKQVLR